MINDLIPLFEPRKLGMVTLTGEQVFGDRMKPQSSITIASNAAKNLIKTKLN
jgi:hypothetical protein